MSFKLLVYACAGGLVIIERVISDGAVFVINDEADAIHTLIFECADVVD
jgi:hypothetical protein